MEKIKKAFKICKLREQVDERDREYFEKKMKSVTLVFVGNVCTLVNSYNASTNTYI